MQYLMIENCAFKAGISGAMGYALGGVMGLFMYGVPGAEVQTQSKEKLYKITTFSQFGNPPGDMFIKAKNRAYATSGA